MAINLNDEQDKESKREIEKKVADRNARDMYKQQNKYAYIHWPIILTIPFFFISGGGLWAVIVLWVGYFLAVHFQTEKDMADREERFRKIEEKEKQAEEDRKEYERLHNEFIVFIKDLDDKGVYSDFYRDMYFCLRRWHRFTDLSQEQKEYLLQNEYVRKYGHIDPEWGYLKVSW